MAWPSQETKQRQWKMGLAQGQQIIWIELDGFDAEINSLLKKNLPGPPRWHGDTKRWLFPAKWETCTKAREIANKCNAVISLTDSMYNWAIAEKARQELIPDVQSMELTDLPRVRDEAPAIWRAVQSRPFQTVGAAFAARNRSCLIADQPGLGKTIQSIAAVIESGVRGPIIVVAPKAAASLTWPQELARWAPGDKVFIMGPHIAKDQRETAIANYSRWQEMHDSNTRIWIITSPNYLRVKADLDKYGNYTQPKTISAVQEGIIAFSDVLWSAVIVDESHQTLAGCTGNKKKQSAQRLGLGALQTRPDGIRIALSGTPLRGKEQYIWGQLNWLRPDIYRSYWDFIGKYFDSWRDRYGMQIGRMVDAEGMYAEARTVMIRRTKAEVASDLPPKMYGGWPIDPANPDSPIAVWLDMGPKQKKHYDDMWRAATVDLSGGTLMANGVLAELTRLKQFAGSSGKMEDGKFRAALPSNKFDWLVEFLDERGIDKDMIKVHDRSDVPKIVVTSQFSQLIEIIHEGLKEQDIKSYKFTGATSDKNREAIKESWQNNPQDDTRVLLLTTTAGGVSLTLDAASELVVLDETWNPADQEQVEDRIHRLSRMHQVTIWNLRSRDTIEESIAKSNLDRDNSIKGIIDGERGMEFVSRLMAK